MGGSSSGKRLGWILSVITSIFLSKYIQSLYFPSTPCTLDPSIVLRNNDNKDDIILSWEACQVYSTEYYEARDKFRKAVNLLASNNNSSSSLSEKIELHSLSIVEDLTIDIAIIRGNGPGVVFHSSALHGVEGYAGSAIQIAFLKLLEQQQQQTINLTTTYHNRPTIVLIHAMNPYGMKYYRRVNEHNVDLNRNAISDFKEFLKYREPNIGQYDTFREFVSASRSPTTWDTTLGWWGSAIPKLIQHGFTSLKTVLVAGQYHHPEGFSFGGTEIQPSIEKLMQFCKDQDLFFLHSNHTENDNDVVVWIDVHSGLGKFGKDTLMVESKKKDSEFRKWFTTSEHIVTESVSDKKAMSGYELTKGILTTFLKRQKPSGMFLIQEFGTLPGILVGRYLILENMAYQYGMNAEDKARRGRMWMQSAFYPQSTTWRESIVQRGVSVLLQAMDYSIQEKNISLDEKEEPSSYI